MTVDVTSNADEVIFATGGYDHTIKIWQASTGICQRVCHHVDSVLNFFLYLCHSIMISHYLQSKDYIKSNT